MTKRLDDLRIEEVSGVDSGAHLSNGWVVIKAETPPDGDTEMWRRIHDHFAPKIETLAAGFKAIQADLAALAPDDEKPKTPQKKPTPKTPAQKLAAATDSYRSHVLGSGAASSGWPIRRPS